MPGGGGLTVTEIRPGSRGPTSWTLEPSVIPDTLTYFKEPRDFTDASMSNTEPRRTTARRRPAAPPSCRAARESSRVRVSKCRRSRRRGSSSLRWWTPLNRRLWPCLGLSLGSQRDGRSSRVRRATQSQPCSHSQQSVPSGWRSSRSYVSLPQGIQGVACC